MSVIFSLGTSAFSDVAPCHWASSYVLKDHSVFVFKVKGPKKKAAYENMKTELGKTICLPCDLIPLCWNQSQRVKTMD